MHVAYRLSADEFVFLASALSLKQIPNWVQSSEETIDLTQVITSLVNKHFLLEIEEGCLPTPLFGCLFENLAAAIIWIRISQSAFCYISKEMVILLEKADVKGKQIRLYPFEKSEDCLSYLKECPYAQGEKQIFVAEDTPDNQKTAVHIQQLWEAMN